MTNFFLSFIIVILYVYTIIPLFCYLNALATSFLYLSKPTRAITVPILSFGLPFSLYHFRVAEIKSLTLLSGRKLDTWSASRGCLPCFPPVRTSQPFFLSFQASVGHALIQSPQYTHLDSSNIGLPSLSDTIAPSWQALAHKVHPLHKSLLHTGYTTP